MRNLILLLFCIPLMLWGGVAWGICGNGICDYGEYQNNQNTCPQDCISGGACGDGSCNYGENCGSCPGDCGACATCNTPPHGTSTTTTPSGTLCAVGTPSGITTTNTQYTWTCGGTVNCNANRLYTVSYAYYLGGPDASPPITRTYGQAHGRPVPIASTVGYTFNGWFTTQTGGTMLLSTTPITSNITYYAQWTQNTYTVTFSGNGGVGHTPTTKSVNGNAALGTLPSNPLYTGYGFNGWWSATTGGSLVTGSTVITGNRTVYAQWYPLPLTGACGNASNVTYPYNITGYAPALQCATGTPTTTAFPDPGTTQTWRCSGLYGGTGSSVCSASRGNIPVPGSCGTADGKVYAITGSSYLPDTQCAVGTPTNIIFPAPGDSETRNCVGLWGGTSSPVCAASRQSASCSLSNRYASGSIPGRRCPEEYTLAGGPGCYQCVKETLGVARCAMPECGNGILDLGEECDDGNVITTDACTNECLRPYCGDGVFTPSATWTTPGGALTGIQEMCDPAMTGALGVMCPSTCLFTGTVNASCNVSFPVKEGYGKTFEALNQVGQLCYPFGFAIAGTHTDETWNRSCNGLNGGLDATGCSLPRRRCGDGVLDNWEDSTKNPKEECDDGNTNSGDGCDATCQFEPVIEFQNGSGLCTIQSYPQIELGEYLPIWWIGSKTNYLYSGTSCTTLPVGDPGGIQLSSLQGDIEIYRGGQEGQERVGILQSTSIATQSTQGAAMINDAILDFDAGGKPLIGTQLIDPQVVSGWVNTGGQAKYGQYLMRLPEVTYAYCAWARGNKGAGTATGQVNPLIMSEACDDHIDNDGNGKIDCADPACASEANCQPRTGTGTQSCLSNSECTDGKMCNGQEVCVLGSCVAGSTPTPYDICLGILPGAAPSALYCDDAHPTMGGCRSSQRYALGMSLCYEALLARNSSSNAGSAGGGDIGGNGGTTLINTPCTGLTFTAGGNCTITDRGCNTNPVMAYDSASFQGPVYAGMTPPVSPLAGLPNSPLTESQITQLRAAFVSMNPSMIQSILSTWGVQLNQNYSSWLQQWKTSGQGDSVASPVYTPPVIPINNECDLNKINCSLDACKTQSACAQQENCFNNIDDDANGLIDADDPVCVWFYEFEKNGHTPIPNPTQKTENFVYTGSDGKVCEAGFSVSKGYFVQQGFAFTEEANAGLDASEFVNIDGVPLVTEGTALADDQNTVATYNQAGAKAYLFDGFVDAWEQKATNNIRIGTSNMLRFKKVPNAQIYFWQGELSELSNGNEVLRLNQTDRNLLLREYGGVEAGKEELTPYTIVLPGSTRQGNPKQVLEIEGSLEGNALYVSQGDIKFVSASCDSSDTVEGLFIAAGEFTTNPINNKNQNATRRCKGGNLKIRGTLLGSNAGSTLAPLRRSVIDARNPDATFFDNSLVFQAKELFETCYLPALAMRKAGYPIPGTSTTQYNGPLTGCTISSLNTVATRNNQLLQSKEVINTFLTTFTNQGNIFDNVLKGAGSTTQMQYVLSMMDNVQSTTTPFAIPTTIVIIQPNGTTTSPISINQNSPLIAQMQATNKRFPAWWFTPLPNGTPPTTITLDLSQGTNKMKFMNDVSRAFGEIRNAMIEFDSPLKMLNSTTLDVSIGNSLWGALKSVFTANSAIKNFINNVPSGYCVNNNIGYNLFNGLSDPDACKASFYNDFKWIVDNKQSANTQGTTLASNIVDGSSVVISSQPKLWTDLPPGAKDFLNNIVVVPR